MLTPALSAHHLLQKIELSSFFCTTIKPLLVVCLLNEYRPALALQLMVHHSLYLEDLPSLLDLGYCGFGDQVEAPNVEIIEEYLGDFLEEGDLLEEQVHIQLLLALLPALVVLLHLSPVNFPPQHAQEIVNAVPQVNNKVELFRTI